MIAWGSSFVGTKDTELNIPVTSDAVLSGEEDAVDALSRTSMRGNLFTG